MELIGAIIALVIGLLALAGMTVLLIVPVTIWRGFVLSKLWLWLIIPVFPNAPALSITTAIGVSIVLALFTSGLAREKAEKKENQTDLAVFASALLGAFISPAISLLFGYIVSLYM